MVRTWGSLYLTCSWEEHLKGRWRRSWGQQGSGWLPMLRLDFALRVTHFSWVSLVASIFNVLVPGKWINFLNKSYNYLSLINSLVELTMQWDLLYVIVVCKQEYSLVSYLREDFTLIWQPIKKNWHFMQRNLHRIVYYLMGNNYRSAFATFT